MSSEQQTPLKIGAEEGLAPPVMAFRAVLMAAQRLRYLMDARLRPDGVTTQQAALLTVVTALDRPTLGEAAAALGTTHQNVAQLAASLERKGWLTSGPDPEDRRRRRLATTERNAEYWDRRNPGDHAAVAEWFSMLSDEEVTTLAGLTATRQAT